MYFSMDVMEKNMIKDLRNPLNQIQFNYSSMEHVNPGIVNRALCVKDNNVLLKKKDICSGEECFLAVWLKHHCNSNSSVFITPTFTIFCSDVNTSSIKILYKSCYFIVAAKYNLWYHLSIGMKGDKVDVYIDGEKVEYLKQCGVTSGENIEDVIVSTSRDVTCLDEIFVYSSVKTEDEVKQLYNTTVFGKFNNYNLSL